MGRDIWGAHALGRGLRGPQAAPVAVWGLGRGASLSPRPGLGRLRDRAQLRYCNRLGGVSHGPPVSVGPEGAAFLRGYVGGTFVTRQKGDSRAPKGLDKCDTCRENVREAAGTT